MRAKPASIVLLLFVASFSCASPEIEDVSTETLGIDCSQTHVSNNVPVDDQLDDKVLAACPGDVLNLAPGTYWNRTLNLEGAGTDVAPILIDGLDQVIFKGTSSLVITGKYLYVQNVHYVNTVPQGSLNSSIPKYFAIVSIGTWLPNDPITDPNGSGHEVPCTGCRLVSSHITSPAEFTAAETATDDNKRYEFVKIIGTGNKLVRDTFSGRRHRAPVVHVWKTGIPSLSVVDDNHIYRCVFTDNQSNDPSTNGGEQIVIGAGNRADYNSAARVTECTFDNVSGDGEIISVKSSGVLIADNQFSNSCGAISLRQGTDNTVLRNIYRGKGFDASGGRVCDLPGSENDSEGIVLTNSRHIIEHNHIQNVGTGITFLLGEERGDHFDSCPGACGCVQFPCPDACPLDPGEEANTVAEPNNTAEEEDTAHYRRVREADLLNNSLLNVKIGIDYAREKDGAYDAKTCLHPDDVLMQRSLIRYFDLKYSGWNDQMNPPGSVTNGVSYGNYNSNSIVLQVVSDGLLGPDDAVVSTIYGSSLSPRY